MIAIKLPALNGTYIWQHMATGNRTKIRKSSRSYSSAQTFLYKNIRLVKMILMYLLFPLKALTFWTDLCSRVALAVPGRSTTDPGTAIGAFAVTPDPGDRAGRADGAAAL